MMNKKKLARDISTVAALSALSLGAMAQDDWVLEEIVVTAQKRAQSVQDIGVAVSAFSGDDVKELNMTTAKDLAAQTPGLSAVNSQSGGMPIFAIRGIGLDDYNINNSSGVGVYTDEVFASSPAFLNFQLMDVERVEVLKGPQGTLYGKNTTGGAITFVSNKPTEEREGYVTGRYGRYNSYELEGAVGGQIVDGVNGRVAVAYTDQRDGWQKDVYTGEEYGKEDKVAVRALLQFEPTDDVDVLWNIHGGRDRSVSESPTSQASEDFYAGVFSMTAPTLDRRNVASTAIPERNEEGYGSALTITADYDAFTLTSVTGWDTYNRTTFDNYDGSSFVLNDRPAAKNEAEQLSQEIRLTSNSDGDFSWIVGLNYSEESAQGVSSVAVGDVVADGVFNLASTADTAFDQDVTSYGVFVHTETQLNEQWKLTVGARYSYDEVDYQASIVDSTNAAGACFFGLLVPAGITPADCATDVGTLFGGPAAGYAVNDAGFFSFLPTGMEFVNVKDTNDSDNVSGKIALDYTPNDDWLFYASVATSYKGGRHFASPVTTAAHLEYLLPEELIAYELGFKSTLFDGKLQVNGAAFMTEYENRQSVLLDDTLVAFLGTVPESEIAGFELDAWWRPLEGLEMKVGTSYINSKVTKGPTVDDLNGVPVSTDIEGEELSQAPEWTYNALLRYSVNVSGELMLKSQLDYSWTDDQVAALSDANAVSGPVKSLGARVALTPADDAWELALYGKNLTNEDDATYSFTNFNGDRTTYWQEPASYGVEFTYNFL